MYCDQKEKWETEGIKLVNQESILRQGKLHVLENARSGHHQTSENEGKK